MSNSNLNPGANSPLGIACIVTLVGPPASGKTTWARRNCAGAVLISQDELIEAITPGGFAHVYRPIYAAAEDAVARMAMESGHTVIVDRTNRTCAHRKRWLQIAREFQCPAIALEMTTPASICRTRNRAREGPRRLSEERLERMLAAMERVRPDEGFTAIYAGEAVNLADILSEFAMERKRSLHEYCHETR